MANFKQFLPRGRAEVLVALGFGYSRGEGRKDENTVASLPHTRMLHTQEIEMNSSTIRFQNCCYAAQAAKNNFCECQRLTTVDFEPPSMALPFLSQIVTYYQGLCKTRVIQKYCISLLLLQLLLLNARLEVNRGYPEKGCYFLISRNVCFRMCLIRMFYSRLEKLPASYAS